MRKSEIGLYTLLPRWVFDLDISPEALRLYLYLGFRANRDTDKAWPSKERIAIDLGAGIRSIHRWMAELESYHAIEVQRTPGSRTLANVYTVMYSIPEYLRGVTDETYLDEGDMTPVADAVVTPVADQLEKDLELDVSPGGETTCAREEQPPPGRIKLIPKESDEARLIAYAVWEQRKKDKTMPISANFGQLVSLTRKVVAKVGSEKAHAVLMDVPVFSATSVDIEMAKNGKTSKAARNKAVIDAYFAKETDG